MSLEKHESQFTKSQDYYEHQNGLKAVDLATSVVDNFLNLSQFIFLSNYYYFMHCNNDHIYYSRHFMLISIKTIKNNDFIGETNKFSSYIGKYIYYYYYHYDPRLLVYWLTIYILSIKT